MREFLETPVPKYEQDESQPLVTSADSLPPRTAKRLYKAASQGQLGKAWRQLRAPPPVFIGPDQWNEALAKFTPHEEQEGPPLREDITPERWFPTPREYNHAISKLKRNKAADAGGVDHGNSPGLHGSPAPKTNDLELDSRPCHCH